MSVTWYDSFMETMRNPWVVIGFTAQALFFFRWIVQWYVSERCGRSVVPLSFWIISLVGGVMLLIYALQEGQPVFVVGQLVGICNYSRNIVLVRRNRGVDPDMAPVETR